MSGFKGMVAADNRKVFLNTGEFAACRTVIYNGKTYAGIPAVMAGVEEKDRRAPADDHAQGLFKVAGALQCSIDDLGGNKPEKGQRIKVSGEGRGNGFFHEFYVATSVCELGMLRVGLEAIDE